MTSDSPEAEGTASKPSRRRRIKRWLGISCLALVILLVLDYWTYPLGNYFGGSSHDRGENGLWLRYTWYFGEKDSSEVDRLAADLTKRHIRYAYFHVRYIRADGSLKFKFPSSRALTQRLAKAAPEVLPIAWVYVDGSVQLDKKTVRTKMIEEAQWLIDVCGFRGVQWDYEPCASGDQGLLALLEQTRGALPGTHLSVAAPVWYPWPLGSIGWSEDYFGEVGKRCDQIAIMCYDSGFYTPRSYAWLVGQQAKRLPKTAAPAQIVLGLPTYGPGLRSHNPRSENLKIALKAVREGPAVAGIALFADYTTGDEEWQWYERAWLRR